MTLEVIIVGLFLVLIGQSVYFGIVLQTLINKLMSRDYYTYETANAVSVEAKARSKALGTRVPVSPMDMEDLGQLDQFG